MCGTWKQIGNELQNHSFVLLLFRLFCRMNCLSFIFCLCFLVWYILWWFTPAWRSFNFLLCFLNIDISTSFLSWMGMGSKEISVLCTKTSFSLVTTTALVTSSSVSASLPSSIPIIEVAFEASHLHQCLVPILSRSSLLKKFSPLSGFV